MDCKSAISEVSDAAENTAGMQHFLDAAAFISRAGPLVVGAYVSRIQWELVPPKPKLLTLYCGKSQYGVINY